MVTKSTFRFAIWFFLVLVLAGCASQKPILIGFAAELTGTRGELGVEMRDGAQLAVDIINENGGIDGRPIELIARDDKGDPDTARQVDAELVEQGVVAIIGHVTSAQTAAVFDQMNAAEVVLFSPSSTSTQFSGQTDYFFRSVPSTDLLGESLAAHIYNNRNVRHLSYIYDLRNQAFVEPLWQSIQAKFTELGGNTGQVFPFTSGEMDLKALVSQVKATEPESVVIIASAVDTALMAQYGRQQGLDAMLFSSSWAQTNELLEKGGQAVEGLEMISIYHSQNPYPAFQPFVERFEARYNRPPGLLSSSGYEAVLVLTRALEQTGGEADGLSEALATIKNLAGVQGIIALDEYGDVRRDVYIAVVKDGQFEIIDTISPAD